MVVCPCLGLYLCATDETMILLELVKRQSGIGRSRGSKPGMWEQMGVRISRRGFRLCCDGSRQSGEATRICILSHRWKARTREIEPKTNPARCRSLRFIDMAVNFDKAPQIIACLCPMNICPCLEEVEIMTPWRPAEVDASFPSSKTMKIPPSGHRNQMDLIKFLLVQPPNLEEIDHHLVRLTTGMGKTGTFSRIRSVEDIVMSRRCCSICHQEGHNSRTCSVRDPSEHSSIQEETTSTNDRLDPQLDLTLSLGLPGKSLSSRPQTPVVATTSTGVKNHSEVPANRGVRWSAEEHLNFLKGVQALGNGAWKAISERFVRTRTANQISSHAQKYHKRRRNPLKRKRNPSIFDVGRDEFPPLARFPPMQRFYGIVEHQYPPPPHDNQLNPLPPPSTSPTPPPEARAE
ncbi:hypothetical protein MLD38_005512 [Melastoma candidum]|uniref:Uncharacterized protein n=1 Tax=Melastoma candidum TaxID=119954 RepID=A0ACB9RJY6_9MYRT|nr:hypothetical protein MLD38_005512 [Melastoma candidum]